MQVTAGQEQLELRSVFFPALPLFLAILSGGALATTAGSTIPRLLGLAIIGVAFLMVDLVHLKRVLLTIVILEIPLQLDTFINHDPSKLASANGFNISLTTFCLVALYALWMAELAAGKNRALSPIASAAQPAMSYVAAVLVSVLVADSVLLSLYEVNVIGQALLLLVYMIHAVRTQRDVLMVVSLLVLGLAIQSVIAVAQSVFGTTLQLGPIRTDIIGGSRVAGTLRHANRLGAFVGLTMGPALGLMMAGRLPRIYRLFGTASFLLGVVALLLTQSRGAVLGVLIAMSVTVTLAYRRHWLTKRIIILGGAALLVIIATQVGGLASRIGGLDDNNVVGRFRLMELSFMLIRQSPLFGVGSNQFSQALSDVVTLDFAGAWIATVHNKYMLVWVETGIVGLLAFGYFVVAMLRRAWRVFMDDDPFLGPIGLGFVASSIAVMVHMNFDKFASRVDVHLLWLVAGIVFALHRVSSSRVSPARSAGRLEGAEFQ